MAEPIKPEDVMDFDQPLNTDPMYSVTHTFSSDDVTGTFDGLTQGRVAPGETPVVDFTATPIISKEGVNLYPINSEFGFIVTDFDGAIQKDFFLNPEYTEGFVGDVKGIGGEQIGIQVSDAPTDTFKTPALLGTWLAGLGGNSVKASTEHYSVMQHVLSDQKYPGDPDAVYPLDDELRMIGGEYDGMLISDIIPLVGDVNGDGTQDIRDVLSPNESTIAENIAASTDYSVTLKDDGKLLYRWGNMVKRPNDVRLEAELKLPDEWQDTDDSAPAPLYRVTQAELVLHHTITNNPNDQIRPEDYENESAIGTLPEYEVLPDGTWVSTDDYYAGDGTLYPAGTVLKDPTIPEKVAGTPLDQIGALSSDLDAGFTNAWYTTMNREPFEPVLNDDGTEYVTGPRWRYLPDKYGQDLPGVVIPADPSLPPPPKKGEEKYVVGAETQTVINLLDWALPVSPMSISAGWQNEAGTVSENGLNRTQNFDVAFYIKGDIKPTTMYSAELVMDYEEIEIFSAGESITGTEGSDYLVGMGGNAFSGGAGSDLFVLSYGADSAASAPGSTIADFEVGQDTLGLINLGVTDDLFEYSVTQSVADGKLSVMVDGTEVAALAGVSEKLDVTDFLLLNTASDDSGDIIGTSGDDMLIGDASDNTLLGLAGNDTLIGLPGNDTLIGGTGNDTLDGRDGDDRIEGGFGNDEAVGGIGNDVIIGGDGFDMLAGQGGDDQIAGSAHADTLLGGLGNDFLNGGFSSDSLTGGDGADAFFHQGLAGHGSDWVHDYNSVEADVLVFGDSAASADDFQVNFAHAADGELAGDDTIEEAFVIYKPTGQILWALVDGAEQSSIDLQMMGSDAVFDLLA